MDWNPARIWPKAFGLALALVSAAGLLSFDLNDPTFTNLRAHSQGIANWMGLPGALVGGSLVEIFGSASLLVPLLILNWLVTSHHRPPIYAYLCWSVFLMAAVASIHGLFRPPSLPGVGDAGLAGWSAGYWMAITTGPWAGGALLVFIGLYAGNRLLFHPVLRIGRQALGDASFFLLSMIRDGWLRIRQNLPGMNSTPGWRRWEPSAGRERSKPGRGKTGRNPPAKTIHPPFPGESARLTARRGKERRHGATESHRTAFRPPKGRIHQE